MALIFSGGDFVKSCYSYGVDGKWVKLAGLTTPKYGSSSIPIPHGILVSGGSGIDQRGESANCPYGKKSIW